MKRRSYFRRGLSVLLSALLCLSLAMPAFAVDAAGNSDVAESSITLDPGESADTGDPADISEPLDAANPAGSADTSATTDPADTSNTADSDVPAGTEDPTGPGESADPGAPLDPGDPAGAGTPDSSGNPASSGDPGSSGPLASSDAPEDSGQEAPPAEESRLPVGRAWLTGNYGTAWLSNGGIRPFSVGDTVYISRGEAIYYAYYQTYKYTATVNGQDYLCFCAEPSQSSTTGYYTVSKIDGNTLGGRRLLAAMLRGWGGPLYNEGWFSDNLSDNHRYAFTHALIGVIYSGDTKGLPQNIVEWTQIVITENDQLLADPNSELSQVIDDYTVYVAYNDAGQDMVWMEQNSDTVIHLTKTSTNSGITNGNASYSLAGAVYGVYSDAGCTQLVTTITTDASGKGTSETISQGNYWLKEITPSPGYQLDGEIYPVTADTTEVNANVTEVPASDALGITLTKIAAEEGSDIPSLAGTQFTIRYYDGQYSSVDQLPGSPTRTWVLETQLVGDNYLAALGDHYKVSGDAFYYEAGQPTLPIGTITIQETKAPDGYTMEGSYLNNSTGQTVSDSNGIVLLNVTQDSLGGHGFLQGGNAYTKEDTEIHGGVVIYKRDAETGETVGQGNATVQGARFEIVNRTGRTITVNGTSYANDQVVYSGSTDASGLFQTNADLLPYGTYELREVTPPTGYTGDGTTSRTFSIEQDGVVVDLTAPDSSISNKVIRGGVQIYKYDADTQEHQGQGAATVEGAIFEIVNRSSNAVLVNGTSYTPGSVVYTGSTDESGLFETSADLLPYGTYELREATPPTGYTGDGTTSRTFSIEQDGVVVDLTTLENSIINEVIRGGVKLYKYDSDTQEHQGQGDATVAGAKFEIVNRSGAPVVVNGVTYDSGEVVYTGYTDDTGLFQTAEDLLPYGHYEVREATPPSGYTSNGTTSQEFDILEDGVIVDLTAFDDSISNKVIRGDFELRKVDGDFQTSMSNVVFKITSEATGESHTFVTDDNGYYSSAASWIPHTQDTNGGHAASGLWFGAGDPDNSIGALPYGTYTIEEQPCEANQDYILWTGIITISRDNVTINLNNVENFQMRLSTSAAFESNGSQWGPAETGAVVIDTVRYENLLANTNYTMMGTLVDQATGAVLTDTQGNPIAVTRAFTTTTRNGSLKMAFNFDASNLAGKTLVVFEELYLGHGDAMSADPVIVHADLADEAQTIHFPAIDTRATDLLTGTNVSSAQSPVSIVDTVSYSNLQTGKRYTLNGTLMDAKTGLPVYGADGAPVTATTSFIADAANGMATVTFTFDGSTMAGRTLVVYETLQWYNDTLASHTDLDDPDQTVHLPRIGTSALDSETDDHIGMADQEMTLVDTVAYENLAVGKTYTVTGTLYVKSTGEALKDADGNPVTASAEFVAETADGSVDLTFVFDASTLAGESIVAYESLTYNGVEVAVHADIDDEGQTVHIPEIGTTAIDAESGTHNAMADESVTIVDAVDYTNLIPGKEYTISGVLYNKATGEPLLDKDDAEITASTTFTAESADGAVEITFQFDGSLLAGETVVAFETLEYQGVEVAIHADITDKDQTIHFPEIGTTATEQESGEHVTLADDSVTIQDVVAYENLIPGQSYTISGVLMNAATGEAILDAQGNQVAATADFVAKAANGSIILTFQLDASALAGQSVVAYETLYTNNTQVAIHADIDDEGQTVHFPEVGTSAVDSESGDHNSIADTSVTIVDTVSYSNLIADGREYTVTGTLMDKATGEKLLDAQGNEITSSVTFVPEKATGTADVTFTFDGSHLAADGAQVVVFESVQYKGREVAVHADINDLAQTILFPAIHTAAAVGDTGEKEIEASGIVTIVDTVSYCNLAPGETYTLVGSLMNKTTGDVVPGTTGSDCISKVEFVPTEANGSVQVSFQFDTAQLSGQDVVVFETLYRGTDITVQPVAIHADINNENQTVKILVPAPEVPNTSPGPKTGDFSMPMLFAGMGLLAAAVLVILVRASKKGHGKSMQ